MLASERYPPVTFLHTMSRRNGQQLGTAQDAATLLAKPAKPLNLNWTTPTGLELPALTLYEWRCNFLTVNRTSTDDNSSDPSNY
ncbi:hypothetical protein BJ999_006367 [Actinomadura citrea]|uniref:Uncharacterized protein n=1 Tax=Actinomadura citrea TaxID=46158 RepID=A0A7Y9KG36_9ACTN|nr:hypothetical protein [Actinomadura citrea]GGT80936.1 hypothetical protein GCM10010177_44950 [Actinomadura citrea]